MTINWPAVAARLEMQADAPQWGPSLVPTEGQRNAIAAIARRLRDNKRSLLLADEVGVGKTLIAVALVKAVQVEGGRSAVVIPPGLGAQWQAELRRFDPKDTTLSPLRSYWTFLDVFERPEDVADRDLIRSRRAQELASRRQQRELPRNRWCDEPVLLLSHNLGTIRSTNDTQVWHKGLVDAIRKVADGTRRYRRDPRGGIHHNIAREAAERILEYPDAEGREALVRQIKNEKISLVDRQRAIVAGGLGRFDLVIIDEAHKARRANSSLSRVLGDMTWKTADAFRLGLTATPVELDPQQWLDTLARLNLSTEVLASLRPAIDAYVKAVDKLRTKVALTPKAVEHYCQAARIFQTLLSTWVLRRDQRDDCFMQRFCLQYGSHRIRTPIEVSLSNMSLMWKRAFFASEAMSLLAEHNLTPAQRRLRLSLPEGRRVDSAEAPGDVAIDPKTHGQRAWVALAREVTGDGGVAIFAHPSITRTVGEIEALVAQGQKVLVFGRFTRPMRALTFLLDAREMVRRLCAEEGTSVRWPEAKFPVNTFEREAALKAALADPGVNTASLDRAAVEQRMTERATRHEAARRGNLAEMHAAIERTATAGHASAVLLLDAWHSGATDEGLLAALEDQRPAPARNSAWTENALLTAFDALVHEVRGHSDDGEESTDQSGKPRRFEELLSAHLADFSTREGHFARLMDGSSAPQTRRLLQAAFNREASWPNVLVVQSTVGREGLNLQAACRAVVMLHLEWNPGNVEQQIGRVDRIGSRWRREAAAYQSEGGREVPRIMVRPVLVRGTYADYQWSVLMRRWDNLRAQLNGEVLAPSDLGEQNEDLIQLLEAVRKAIPNFSPPSRRDPF